MHILLVSQRALLSCWVRPALSLSDHISNADNATKAICQLNLRAVDVVLVDGANQFTDHQACIGAIVAAAPCTALAAITFDNSDNTLTALVRAGATGLIPRSSTIEVIRMALFLLSQGHCYLPISITRNIAGWGSGRSVAALEAGLPRGGLSPRQQEVLEEALCGKPNKQIARELGVSEGTVKAHLSAAFRNLGVHNRMQAAQIVWAGSPPAAATDLAAVRDRSDRPEASSKASMVAI